MFYKKSFFCLLFIMNNGYGMEGLQNRRIDINDPVVKGKVERALEHTAIIPHIMQQALKDTIFKYSQPYRAKRRIWGGVSNDISGHVIYREDNRLLLSNCNGVQPIVLAKITQKSFTGAFNSQGTKVAISFGNDHVHIYDTTSGKLERSMQLRGNIISLAYSINGTKLATGYEDAVVLWDIATAEPLCQFPVKMSAQYLQNHDHNIQVSSDGILFTTYYLKELVEWESRLKDLSLEQKLIVRVLWDNQQGICKINVNKFFEKHQYWFADDLRHIIYNLFM